MAVVPAAGRHMNSENPGSLSADFRISAPRASPSRGEVGPGRVASWTDNEQRFESLPAIDPSTPEGVCDGQCDVCSSGDSPKRLPPTSSRSYLRPNNNKATSDCQGLDNSDEDSRG